jgi:predicted dehydrogenase
MMANQNLNVVVVGCGRIAMLHHLPNIARSPRWTLVGIVEKNDHRRAVASDTYLVPGTRTLSELLEVVQPAAVVIATHELEHFACAHDALSAGLHVFLEKPFTSNIEEGDELIDLAQSRGLGLFVGFQKLYDPAVTHAKGWIDGRRSHVAIAQSWNFSHDNRIPLIEALPAQCQTPEFNAGTMDYTELGEWHTRLGSCGTKVTEGVARSYRLAFNLACHDVAILLTLFGDSASVAYATFDEDPLFGTIVLTWRNGNRATLSFGQTTAPWYDEGLRVTSEDGTVGIDWPTPFGRWPGATAVHRSFDQTTVVERAVSVRDGSHSPFLAELDAFHELITHGRPATASSVRVAQSVTKVLYESFRQHQVSRLAT